MNKSKAKRLRKELEHEQLAADRGHQVTKKKLTKLRMVKFQARDADGVSHHGHLPLADHFDPPQRPRPKPLTPVQMAVHLGAEA